MSASGPLRPTRGSGARPTSSAGARAVIDTATPCRLESFRISFRSRLLTAAREGEPFDIRTGLPVSMLTSTQTTTWYQVASHFMDVKWAHASPRHRKGLAEGLTTATVALLPQAPQRPAPAEIRRLLT